MERMRVLVVPALLLLCSAFDAGCSGGSSSASPTQPPADPPPAPEDPVAAPSGEPVVRFDAAQEVVDRGDPVELSWSATNVSSCRASGGWSGARAIRGELVVGPLDAGTTFTLTCSGPYGNVMAMLSVSVVDTVTLAWQPPQRNEDGSPLQDLAGYRIYYGTESGSYGDDVSVPGAESTSRDVRLATGTYYFAMTALDNAGNESGYSNEVVKVVD